MKLVALMKVQASSKCFAQPQAVQTPFSDTGGAPPASLQALSKQQCTRKTFPFHQAGKQIVEFESVMDGPGNGTWLCTAQFLASPCLLMHGPRMLLQSMLRM